MGDRDYDIAPKTSHRPLLGAANNAVIILVAINSFLFIILFFLDLVYQVSELKPAIGEAIFNKQILDWFVLPAQADKLFTRPWTMVLYMFTNIDVWMFVSNILWLGAFGYIFQDMAGNKKLIPIYLYGGFVGAVFFLLSVNFLPFLHQNMAVNAPLIGSGTALVAVAIATTTLAPNYKIFPLIQGGIPLWVLTAVFVIVDFASVARGFSAIAIAHVSAAIIGFVFIKQLGKGRDMGAWMNSFAEWFNDLFSPEKRRAEKKDKLFYKAEMQPFQKTPNITQQKLDTILDKINQHGYPMLTDEEKAFLKRASKEEL